MARYIVSRRSMSNGDHEVHNVDSNCPYLPSHPNRVLLGDHETCETAVKAARQFFATANGCYNCATGCHVHGGVAANQEGAPYRR